MPLGEKGEEHGTVFNPKYGTPELLNAAKAYYELITGEEAPVLVDEMIDAEDLPKEPPLVAL